MTVPFAIVTTVRSIFRFEAQNKNKLKQKLKSKQTVVICTCIK